MGPRTTVRPWTTDCSCTTTRAEGSQGAPSTCSRSESILRLLGVRPADLVRRDAAFDDLGVDPATLVDADLVVDLLVEHPRLMQRPIGVRGDRAVIARPAELILDLLDT